MQRETFMLFGGASDGAAQGGGDGRMWVCATGYLTGHQRGTVFDIPATGQGLRLRWAEFLRFEGDRIAEIQFFVDFIDWFDQIGLPVLPPCKGQPHLFPPPKSAPGLLYDAQDASETAATLSLGRGLLFDGLNTFDESALASMGMARFFHEDVQWYGPGGIGACLSLKAFQEHHQQPWLTAFPDRKVQTLDALFAEGPFLGATGVVGVIASHTGQYLDHPATGNQIRFYGLDFWLRREERFAENWVFVDMVDIFRQFGTDLFARMQARAKHKGMVA
jgi:predicted ester cyclase